jgi:hypothetical protein
MALVTAMLVRSVASTDFATWLALGVSPAWSAGHRAVAAMTFPTMT